MSEQIEGHIMQTYNDILTEVCAILGSDAKNYNVNALAAELVRRYDVTGSAPDITVNDIDSDEFWDIVRTHHIIRD